MRGRACARGSARRDRRTGFTLPLSLGESAFHRPGAAPTLAAPGRWKTPESALQADACPPSRSPCSHLPRSPRNRHRPRTRSVATPRSHLDCRWTRKGLVNMRLPWRKRESESSANSVALVVIELPADELLVEEPAIEELHAEPRRMARLLARSPRFARRLNPAGPARIALGRSGRAAKSVVVKLHPRRLARAVREFRRIGSADFARLAHGVGRGAKGVGGRLSLISPRKARSVRVVTTALRRLVQDISPSAATRVARETTQLARTTIAKLDPRRVEDAVRRVAATIDLDGKGKVDKPGRSTRFDKIAKAAVTKIGPERAVRMAAEATRALKCLVDRLDPVHVGEVIGELVAAARSANDMNPPYSRAVWKRGDVRRQVL